jgi:hypothetical protein
MFHVVKCGSQEWVVIGEGEGEIETFEFEDDATDAALALNVQQGRQRGEPPIEPIGGVYPEIPRHDAYVRRNGPVKY